MVLEGLPRPLGAGHDLEYAWDTTSLLANTSVPTHDLHLNFVGPVFRLPQILILVKTKFTIVHEWWWGWG